MPKTPLSAPGDHRPKESHPVHNVTIMQGLPPVDLERGRASMRTYESTPELKQHMIDRDMDKAVAISDAVPRRKE